MNALIPFIHSENNDIELLFSLRTLSKHARHIENIFIIGDAPKFINSKVKVFPFKQKGTKDYSIAKKIEYACLLKDIGDDFLFMNDDHFFTRDIPIEYPYYHREELFKGIEKNVYNRYQNETGQYLKKIGKSTKDFDVHCPIIYNKEKFLTLTSLWDEKRNYLVKSMYSNYHNIKGVKYTDCKLMQWDERALKNECFSVYDTSLYKGVLQWLSENYPEPSIFENDIMFEFKAIKNFKDTKENVYRNKHDKFVVDNLRAMEIFLKGKDYVKFNDFKTK